MKTHCIAARGIFSFRALSMNDATGNDIAKILIGTTNPAEPNAAITGNRNEVVMSKITSIVNADPNSDGTAVTVGNDRALGQFKFAAASHANGFNGLNDVVLKAINFSVKAHNVALGTGDQTNMQTSDFFIYNKANASAKSPCTADAAVTADGDFVVTCLLLGNQINNTIDPGTDMTLVLASDVMNARISPSSASELQVSLTNFADINATMLGEDTNIVWNDKDGMTNRQFGWIDYPVSSVNSTLYMN